MEIPLGAEGVNDAIDDRRRAARSTGIRDRIGAVVFVLPEEPAIGGIKTENPLPTGKLRALRWIVGHRPPVAEEVIDEIDAAIGHRRCRIAAAGEVKGAAGLERGENGEAGNMEGVNRETVNREP